VPFGNRPMVGSEPPPLQKRCDSVDPRHEHVRRSATRAHAPRTMQIRFSGKRQVSCPTVGVDYRPFSYRVTNEGDQAFRGSVGHRRHSDPTDPGTPDLSCDDDQGSIGGAAIDVAIPAAQEGLIDFDLATQPIAIGSHHSPAELVEPRASGLIAPKAQYPL